MLPTLLGEEQTLQHDYLYWELFEGKGHNRAIRKGNWKGVIANMFKSDKLELYDLSADLGEQKDVAEQHPEMAEKLSKLIKDARVRSPFWNMESKGFNVEAACKETGVEPPPKKKRGAKKTK